jgi:hypothetical protein
MELTRKVYVDDSDFKVVGERFFINEDEVSADDYMELLVDCIETDEDDEFEDFEECEDCEEDCDECKLADDKDEDDDPEFNMICAWVDAINDNKLCESCVYQVVQDAYLTGKRIGSRDSKLKMVEDLNKQLDV